MADPRRSLLAALGAAVVAFTGLAVGVAVTGSPEQTPAAEPSAGTPAPSASTVTATANSGARSASAMIARTRVAGSWPGANGLSGVNGSPRLDTASVTAFCSARGRACTVAQTYTDRSTWQTMTAGTGWTFENFADFDGVLVISQGLTPNGAQADLVSCADGDHDADWQAFGTLMRTHDRADSIVRLGWEFNEQTSSWRADDPATWISCYRRAADNIRATNPDVVLDWTINAHNTPAGVCDGVSTTCYPGDDYVDIVGIDNYDHYPWSPTAAGFTATAADPEGLTWLYTFARDHGKLFSVGEWGITPTGDAGRENPDFITWMHDWFADHAQYLAYETYFSDCDDSGIQSSLYLTTANCAQNPQSAARYKDLYDE
ncbi:glycoside hydrolase family 26 protein [Symbioplanes lichenis]|uniref:glycoside hydrolase family 26 protein n=1 Tax=Symbioplanes lichenis TaxID=1629072 RepID=UPI00273A326A|nr:glycosyl hydrolase [Actinoplanes lichenis]